MFFTFEEIVIEPVPTLFSSKGEKVLTIPEKIEEVKAEVAASGIESLLASLAKSVSALAEDVKKQREEVSNIKVMAESKVRKFGDRRLKQFRNVKTKVQEPLKIEETPKE